MSVEIGKFRNGFAKARGRIEAELEGLFDEQDLSVESKVLVTLAEFLIDQAGFLQVGNKGDFDFGDASHHESPERTIVQLPDAVGLRRGSRIRAREASIEPFGETLVIRQIFQAEAPFRPVGFAQIEDEIGGPRTIG